MTTEKSRYEAQRVVYHNNGKGSDDRPYFIKMLRSIGNQLDAVGDEAMTVRVMSHGSGISLFVMARSDAELAKGIDRTKQRGVKFLVCANTLKEQSLNWKELYDVAETDIVPSGVAELVRLQQTGYSYIHL